MKKIYLALGSNLGDRESMLQSAIARMESEELHVLRESSIYETEPRGLRDQPWFLNQVIEAETSLFPKQLLQRLKKLELELGRKPSRPQGPRAIDIDILLFGTVTVSSPELDIPHPRMAERRFVLEPLAELVPDLKHPATRQTVRQMLALVQDQPVRRR